MKETSLYQGRLIIHLAQCSLSDCNDSLESFPCCLSIVLFLTRRDNKLRGACKDRWKGMGMFSLEKRRLVGVELIALLKNLVFTWKKIVYSFNGQK